MSAKALGAFLVSSALALFGATGCATDAFCFTDCGGSGGPPDDGGGGDSMNADVVAIDTDNPDTICFVDCGSGPDSGDACMETNSGVEICDGLDNDCNTQIDDLASWEGVRACGDCATDCTLLLQNVQIPVCTPPSNPDGTTPGTCTFDDCAIDFYDADGNPANGCEYYCPHNPNGTNMTDPGGADGCGRDDDCDGEIDEDVGTCTDVENCGECGRRCTIANGTAKCVSTGTPPDCILANTTCEVDTCDMGFADVDGAAENGCEYQCPVFPTTTEVCDGEDNDCNGRIDNVDLGLPTSDPDVGDACFGGTAGVCADTTHEGIKKCVAGQVQCCDKGSGQTGAGLVNGECNDPAKPIPTAWTHASLNGFVVEPTDLAELCNGLDDDCDTAPDDATIDSGGTCGTSVGNCNVGANQCVSGMLDCVGETAPATTDDCDAEDNDCDGVIDGTIPTGGPPTPCTTAADCTSSQLCLQRSGPTDKVCVTPPSGASGPCDVPTAPPPGVPSPCMAGSLACIGGVASCQGSIRPATAVDACGEDSNCDGALDSQPDFQNDVNHCGSCNNDCNAISPGGHGVWACQTGMCVRTGCQFGFINCDANANNCERACTFTSNQEVCNGVDDDCDCSTDETTGPGAIVPPSPTQVCGVGAGATDCNCRARGTPGCPPLGGVTVTCTSGAWACGFPAGFCPGTAPDYCLGQPDACDGVDNNCNGNADENFKPPVLVQQGLGQPCLSSGNGACVQPGTYVCNAGGTATQCNAVAASCASLPGGCTETCDGEDDDCDGSIDEPKSSPGSNATFFVRPSVTQVAASRWMTQYEISRPDATTTQPGSGNGWHTSAPVGETLDQTIGCSVTNRVPWFNVRGPEAAQVCINRGGRLCTTADWTSACRTTAGTPCTRGYNPRGAACTSNQTGAKFCNIGPFDFDGSPANGNQDGLLPTSSGLLQNCWADWAATTGNTATNDHMRDILGNLREFTFNTTSPGSCVQSSPTNTTCIYTLMGGAFNTQSEDGAACAFTFFSVDATFRLFDAGFRCCFDANPT